MKTVLVCCVGAALAAELRNPHDHYEAPLTKGIKNYDTPQGGVSYDASGREITVYSSGSQYAIRNDGEVYQMGKYPYLENWAGKIVATAKECKQACLDHAKCRYGTYVKSDATAAKHNYRNEAMRGECWLSEHTHGTPVACGVPCEAFDKTAAPKAAGFRKSKENKYDVPSTPPAVCTKDVRLCWDGTQLGRVSQAECEKAYPVGHPRHRECVKHACGFGKCSQNNGPGTAEEIKQAEARIVRGDEGDEALVKGAYLKVHMAEAGNYLRWSFATYAGHTQESWIVGYYKDNAKTVQCASRTDAPGCNNNFKCYLSGSSATKEGKLGAKSVCENDDVRVTHVLGYQSKDLFFRTAVSVEILGDGITNVRYMRNLDPDTDKRTNMILGQQSLGDDFTAVSTTSKTDVWVALYSTDERAFAKFGGLHNTDPYSTISDSYMTNPDKRGKSQFAGAAADMGFDLGDVAKGTKASFDFFYVMDKQFDATNFQGVTEGGAPSCVFGCPSCTCDPSVHPSHFNECHRDPWSLHIVVTHLAPRFHARPFEKDSQHRCMMVGHTDKENKCACCTCSAKNQPSLMLHGMRDLGFKSHPKVVGPLLKAAAATLDACAKQCSDNRACKWGSFVERADGSKNCYYSDKDAAVNANKKMIVENCPENTTCHSFLRGTAATVKHEKINLKQKYGQDRKMLWDAGKTDAGRYVPHGAADKHLKIAEGDKNNYKVTNSVV